MPRYHHGSRDQNGNELNRRSQIYIFFQSHPIYYPIFFQQGPEKKARAPHNAGGVRHPYTYPLLILIYSLFRNCLIGLWLCMGLSRLGVWDIMVCGYDLGRLEDMEM